MNVLGYGIVAVLAQIQPPPQSADTAESDGQDLRESDCVEIVQAYSTYQKVGKNSMKKSLESREDLMQMT
ncbi:hypothetical protein OUZ56_012170 [Daphnia magna]|uniref:Uncharacterized protein n=1 Tax=Daphnia magna TaxID=35525 RepID=A0ABQ9Z2E4_9CRUS|nr:hypothetical protein OUZ56_012170 [Daphnia magna]